MNLRGVLRAIRRGWFVVFVCALLGVGGGLAIALLTTREYQADAQLFVSTATAGDLQQLAQGNTFTQARVQSYTSVATSPKVTDAVVAELHLPYSAEQLASKITASAPVNKVLIDILVTDRNAADAATLANAVATQFATVVEQLESTSDAAVSPVKLTVTQPASTPSSPIAPRYDLLLAAGFVVGLALGLGLVVVRDILDNTIKSPSELAAFTGLSLFTAVPFDREAAQTPMSLRADPHSRRSEAFRQLRTNLQFVNVDSPAKVIAVTSAMPQEGKTQASINLAAALAEAGSTVCLVETDLRRPTIANALGLVSETGFTTVLIGQTEVEAVLQNAGQNLAVLTAGQIPPNPAELLTSEHARAIIYHLAERVDYVVLDTAPLLPVADGAEVCAMADATLLVVRANRTTQDQILGAIDALKRVNVTPVGTILSMQASTRSDQYSYYYGSSATGSDSVEPRLPSRRHEAAAQR